LRVFISYELDLSNEVTELITIAIQVGKLSFLLEKLERYYDDHLAFIAPEMRTGGMDGKTKIVLESLKSDLLYEM
jgi:hypothetical protein